MYYISNKFSIIKKYIHELYTGAFWDKFSEQHHHQRILKGTILNKTNNFLIEIKNTLIVRFSWLIKGVTMRAIFSNPAG